MYVITKHVRINAENLYPNTLLVFEYLCNRTNIRVNQVFVSALIVTVKCHIDIIDRHMVVGTCLLSRGTTYRATVQMSIVLAHLAINPEVQGLNLAVDIFSFVTNFFMDSTIVCNMPLPTCGSAKGIWNMPPAHRASTLSSAIYNRSLIILRYSGIYYSISCSVSWRLD